MSNFGKLLKRYRMQNKLSQEELAKRLSTTKQVLSRYETGQRDPKISVAIDWARRLNIPLESLDENEPILPPEITPISQMTHHAVPLIGEVAAGQPILAEESYDVYLDAPSKADYALRVAGESMVPTFLNGDIVYIRATPQVENGTIGVVLIDDSATLKHVYVNQNIMTLISDNPQYAPIIVDLTQHDFVRVLGYVCGFTRMFK